MPTSRTHRICLTNDFFIIGDSNCCSPGVVCFHRFAVQSWPINHRGGEIGVDNNKTAHTHTLLWWKNKNIIYTPYTPARR